jgi:hypothetical protein
MVNARNRPEWLRDRSALEANDPVEPMLVVVTAGRPTMRDLVLRLCPLASECPAWEHACDS